MINYRKILLYINEGTGELIDEYGEKLIWDNSLPKLLLADTVLWECHFIAQTQNNEDWQPKNLLENSNCRIIGNIDSNDLHTPVFQAETSLEYSDFPQGIISFLINTNSKKFAESIANKKSLKGTFVIYGINSNNLDQYFVLAKSNFIAENRPCDIQNLPDDDYLKSLTKEELDLLLKDKISKNELHTLIPDMTDINNKLTEIEETIGNLSTTMDTVLEEL
jgi:hypothetical protein